MEKEARVRRMTSALDEMARQVTPAEEALLRLGAVRVAVYIEETRAVVFLDTPKGRERELGVLSLPAGGPAAFHELFEAVAETGLRYETRGTGRLAEPWDLEDLEPV